LADADCGPGATCSRTCRLNASQSCATNFDCADTGPCIVGSHGIIDGGVFDALIEGNTFQGPFVSIPGSPGRAVQLGGQVNPILRGNYIDGAGASAGGIVVRVRALETATVTRNIVTGTAAALTLEKGPPSNAASRFGSSIFLNDFGGNAARVVLVPGYPTSDPAFQSELSVGGQGNFWGHTCADGGFTVPTDSPSASVRDSHPYGQPVALTPDASLPLTCF
jgi:hypothetical protein